MRSDRHAGTVLSTAAARSPTEGDRAPWKGVGIRLSRLVPTALLFGCRSSSHFAGPKSAADSILSGGVSNPGITSPPKADFSSTKIQPYTEFFRVQKYSARSFTLSLGFTAAWLQRDSQDSKPRLGVAEGLAPPSSGCEYAFQP